MKDQDKNEKAINEINEARGGHPGDRLANLEYLISEISRDVNLLEVEIAKIAEPQRDDIGKEEIVAPERGEELEM